MLVIDFFFVARPVEKLKTELSCVAPEDVLWRFFYRAVKEVKGDFILN